MPPSKGIVHHLVVSLYLDSTAMMEIGIRDYWFPYYGT